MTTTTTNITPAINTTPSNWIYGKRPKGVNGNNRSTRKHVTCENCPDAKKNSCTAVCHGMEVFLASTCNTIRHNSPMASGGDTDVLCAKDLVTRSTPESEMITKERNDNAIAIMVQHIAGFCAKVAKDAREQAVVESTLVLHFIEEYTPARVAEILGERFDEYKGCDVYVRKTSCKTSKAGQKRFRQKGTVTVERTIQRFKDYIRTTHFADRIREVMATGSIDPMLQPVV